MANKPQLYWYKDQLLTIKQIMAVTGWSMSEAYLECPKEHPDEDDLWEGCDSELREALESKNPNELMDYQPKERKEPTKADFKKPVDFMK